jgi:hypothetical protein
VERFLIFSLKKPSQAKACAYQAYVFGFKVAATFRLREIFIRRLKVLRLPEMHDFLQAKDLAATSYAHHLLKSSK